MKESLRHGYQVAIIGGVIVVIVGAIITPRISKYFTTEPEKTMSTNADIDRKSLISDEDSSNKKRNSNLVDNDKKTASLPKAENSVSEVDDDSKSKAPDKNKSGISFSKPTLTVSQPLQHNVEEKPIVISTPRPVLPDNYSEFNYPRHVLLQWTKVPNAVRYKVQVEIFVLQTKEWQDLNKFYRGGTTKYFNDIINNETSLYFTGVGAQPHRWRVKAISETGHESKYSEWQYIIFDS